MIDELRRDILFLGSGAFLDQFWVFNEEVFKPYRHNCDIGYYTFYETDPYDINKMYSESLQYDYKQLKILRLGFLDDQYSLVVFERSVVVMCFERDAYVFYENEIIAYLELDFCYSWTIKRDHND